MPSIVGKRSDNCVVLGGFDSHMKVNLFIEAFVVPLRKALTVPKSVVIYGVYNPKDQLTKFTFMSSANVIREHNEKMGKDESYDERLSELCVEEAIARFKVAIEAKFI